MATSLPGRPQREGNRGTLTQAGGRRPDPPAVPLDDVLAGRQPDPAARVLVPVPPAGVLPRLNPEVENLLKRVLHLLEPLQPLDADAVVGHGDDPFRPFPAGGHAHPGRPVI